MKGRRFLTVVGGIGLAAMLMALPFLVACAKPAPAPAPAPVPAKAEYQWRAAAYMVRPERNASVALFCDLIEFYSDGRIGVEFYPDGVLGGHDEIFHAVQEGSIEIAQLCQYDYLATGGGIGMMPWTIESYDAQAVAFSPPDGIMYRVMSDVWDNVGFHLVWSVTGGGYGFANNVRPIMTPDDFKDLKMRVSGSVSYVAALESMAEGTGLVMETVPWADIYSALERGVVDGCWDVWPALIEERHFEVVKYYTDLNFGWETEGVVINKQLWDELPADLRDAIFKAGRMAEERDFESVRRAEYRLKEQVLESGVEIYYPTPEERALFRERANMREVWEKEYKEFLDKQYPGQNMIDTILDELERIRTKVAGG